MNDLTNLIEARPGPGHNAPPSDIDLLRERLAEQYRALWLRCEALLDSMPKIPEKIADVDTAGKVADTARMMGACTAALDAARAAAKDPYLVGGQTVDDWFRQFTAPLAEATSVVLARLAPWQREHGQVRGELGSVASLRTWWDFRDVDRSNIDLEVLRDYLPIEAIEKALRAFIRVGGRGIAGADIFLNDKSQVR